MPEGLNRVAVVDDMEDDIVFRVFVSAHLNLAFSLWCKCNSVKKYLLTWYGICFNKNNSSFVAICCINISKLLFVELFGEYVVDGSIARNLSRLEAKLNS